MGLSETSSRLTPSRKPRPLGPLEKSSSFLQRSLRELHENRSGSLVAPGSASGFRRSLVGADNTLIEAVAEASREGAAADAADAAAESTEMIRYELITFKVRKRSGCFMSTRTFAVAKSTSGHAMLMLEREGQEARVWDLGSVTGVQRVPKRRRRLRFDVVGYTPRNSGAQFGASHSRPLRPPPAGTRSSSSSSRRKPPCSRPPPSSPPTRTSTLRAR